MTATMTLERKMLHLRSPYTPGFPAAARSVDGLWKPDRQAWIFDPADTDKVMEVVRSFFPDCTDIREDVVQDERRGDAI